MKMKIRAQKYATQPLAAKFSQLTTQKNRFKTVL